jgi:hypothetical protein
MHKHVGRIKKSQRKVIVAYRTLPGDPNSCVCVTTENLEAADHDSLIKLVESNAGQNSYEFVQAMARTSLSDGSNMLARFHTTGKMIKMPTDEVEMTPDLSTKIDLDELNRIIAEQKGVTIAELALTENNEEPTANNTNKNVVPPAETTTLAENSNDVLTDEQLAANYRSQADTMFKEAKRLREEAEKLHPTKKKTVKKSGTT